MSRENNKPNPNPYKSADEMELYDPDFNKKSLEFSDKFFKENNPKYHAVMKRVQEEKRRKRESEGKRPSDGDTEKP